MRTGEGFGDLAKWPAVSWKVFAVEENQITLFEVLGPMVPLSSCLECRKELFTPAVPKHIDQVLNLPPLLTL